MKRAVPPISKSSATRRIRAVPPIEHISVVPPIEKNRPYCSPLIVLFRGARRKWKLIRSMSVLVAARSTCLCADNNSLPLRRLVMIAIVKTITFPNSATHCPKGQFQSECITNWNAWQRRNEVRRYSCCSEVFTENENSVVGCLRSLMQVRHVVAQTATVCRGAGRE